MGILDEAIREHLELKRQHGARDSEIKQMEDEAFGPPSRPGDPEFGDSEEAAERPEAAGGDLTDATAVISSPGTSPEDAVPAAPIEEAGGQAPSEPAPEPPDAGEPLATEHPLPEAAEEAPGGEALAEGEETGATAEREAAEEEIDAGAEREAPEEISAAERARREHPDLGDTMQHEAVGETDQEVEVTDESALPREEPPREEPPAAEEPEAGGEPEAGEPATGVEPEAEEPAADRPHLRAVEPATDDGPSEEGGAGQAGATFYDYAEEEGEEEIDVGDLDLDLDEAFEDLGEEEPAEDGEDARSEGGEPPVPEHAAPEEGEEPAAGEEDLLEETPEFLRDAPDSDALWFEQGEPRDFDFDED